MRKVFFLLMVVLCVSWMAHAAQNNFLDLDGTNDHIRLGDISFGPQFTVEAWINLDNVSGYYEIVSFCDDPNSFCTGLDYEVVFFRVNPYGKVGAGWSPSVYAYRRVEASTTTAISPGQWTHVAVTVDATTNAIAIYFNGIAQPVTQTTAGSGSGTATGSLVVGGFSKTNLSTNSNTVSQFLNGRIDELRIWDIVRSQTELLNTMNNELNGDEAGLVAYYQFNQGTCGGSNSSETVLVDNSGNGYDGILTDLALSGCSSNWVCGDAICGYQDNGLVPLHPIPTLSEWGMAIFALLLLCGGAASVWKSKYSYVLEPIIINDRKVGPVV